MGRGFFRLRNLKICVGCVLFCNLSSLAATDSPNVVIVITDDQGYGDLACHGNPILKTPHLDALYHEAVRFTDYHVAPTCSPTRSALLTGRWTNRTGVWHTIMGRSLLRASEVTLGDLFRDAGYATGMFGKWHLGDNYPYRPEDRGFSEVFRHGGGGIGQTPDYWDNAYFDGTYLHNGQPTEAHGFCTEVFFDSAINFIEDQVRQGRPFLAYIATNAPHDPMHAPPDDARPYAALDSSLANFYGMITNLDRQVGRLRIFLRQKGIEEKTIFVFTTDNGTALGAKVFNAQMRGAKGSPYDGGHRVPFFLRWPAGGFDRGYDLHTLAAHVDLVPTLLDLCQISPPPGLHLDGRSLVPLLKGEAAPWEDRVLFTDSQRVNLPIKWRESAVMTQKWRLVNGQELYAIAEDPGQNRDLAGDFPDQVQQLRAHYEAWWDELEPTFSEPIPIYLGHPAENPSRLTSHDWIAPEMSPWNQALIRQGLGGEKNTGYWNVRLTRSGKYQIRLRRWPVEVDQPLRSALPPGSPVFGKKAFRETPGKPLAIRSSILRIGDSKWEKEVLPEDREAFFEVMLEQGDALLEGRFLLEDGSQVGAYYVYVTYLPSTF